MYDLRTKTMKDSLVRQESLGTGSFTDYQPGNGTSYRFFLTRVEAGSPFGKWNGFGDEAGWIVSFVPDQSHHYNNMAIVQNDGYLDPHYVMEKLGCRGISDAVVLAEVFAHLTGRTAMSSEEFNRRAAERATYSGSWA